MKKFSKKLTFFVMCLFIASQILAQKEKPVVRAPWIDIVAVETFCDSITGDKMIRIEARWKSWPICSFDILDLSGAPICQNILYANFIPQTSSSNGFYEIPQSCIVNGGNYQIIGSCPGMSTSILPFTANFENCNIIGCCPGRNLIVNGDFEAIGNAGMSPTVQYTYNPTVATGATLPGEYNIINAADAATVSPTWLAQDHGTCPTTPNLGKFLAVNGKTGQVTGGWSTVWEQIITVVPNKAYRFCAYMKNLPQCGFDTKPVILVDVNYSLTYQPTNISPPSGLCSWQLVTFNFTPTTTSATITIKLRDTQPGDGNDLAIDDIALFELSPLDLQYSLFETATSNLSSTTYNVTATPSKPLPTTGGCSYWWEVCEVDIAGNCISGTIISNPQEWWTSATNFPGYNGTGGLSGSLPPGVFQIGKRYKIRRGVWCECNSWSQSSFIFEYNRSARKKFKITKVPSSPSDPPPPPHD